MIAFLAAVIVSQAPQTMSAEEIWRRLEAPISIRTDPTRLANALDQIAGMVGVRIRCDAALEPAVVVVGVRNKPAKEIVKHLLDGIGAGSFVQGGTLHVGMKVASQEQTQKQRELELKALQSAIDGRAKTLKIDEPIDPQIAPRAAAQATMSFQSANGEYRAPYQSMYNAASQAPSVRANAGLMRVVGAEALRLENDKSKTITLKSLDDKGYQEALGVFRKLETEQGPWADAFSQVHKLAAKSENYYIAEDLLSRSVSIKGSEPDNFRMIVSSQPWGRAVTIQILSGGEVLFESVESLPRQRFYTDPGGEYFNNQKASSSKVDLAEKVVRVEAYRKQSQDNKPKELDWNLMRLLVDPWRNEPISFTRAQPMADVAQKLDLNLVTYLGDGLITQLAYQFYNDNPTTISGDQVLSLAGYGTISGLRKKGDWLIGYCSNPEQYLSTQLDRPALGRFLNLALRPGALRFEQFLAARKEMGSQPLNTARQLARLVRPGFDSLNPVNIETLDLFAMLRPGQLSQARTVGIPIATLPPELESKLRQFIGYQRRRSQVPDDSIDAPPTFDDIRKSRLFLDQSSKNGILYLDGQQGLSRLMFTNYSYFNFQDFENFRGYSSAQQVAQNFNNRLSWPARMDTLMFRIEVKRKRTQAFGTSQYIVDVTQNPLSAMQAGQLVERYFTGN